MVNILVHVEVWGVHLWEYKYKDSSMEVPLITYYYKSCFQIAYRIETLLKDGEMTWWDTNQVHSKLRSITPMATNIHVISQSFVALTHMHDTIELV